MANPAVFISYSTQDQTIAGMVCQALEQEHIPCWIAPRNVPAGLNAFDSIPKGIEGCTVFVLVLSAHASQSDYVQRELQLALHNKKTIIPLRIEDIKLDGAVNFMLTGVQWMDAFVPPVERHIAALVKRVAAILEVEQQNNPAIATLGNPFAPVAQKRSFALPAMGIAAVVVLGVLAGFMAWNRHPSTPTALPPSTATPAASTESPTVTPAPAQQHIAASPQPKPATPQRDPAIAAAPAPHVSPAPAETPQTPEQLRASAAVLMGQKKMADSDFVSAENYFQLALNLDPSNAAAKEGLTRARKALGEY